MRVTLLGTRGSVPAPGPDTAHFGGNTPSVEVRGDDGTVLVLDAGTGIRRLGDQLPPDLDADRHPADPSAHGPHPGPGLLRAALSPGRRGAHLGPGQRHDVARGPAVPLSLAAAVSGASARPAEHHLPRGAAAAVRDRPVPDRDRAGLSPEPHRRLPHRGAGRHRSPTCPTTSRRCASRTANGSSRSGPRATTSRPAPTS